MKSYASTELNVLDRAIAQELGVLVGDKIPHYTTDLNEAIKFYPDLSGPNIYYQRADAIWTVEANMDKDQNYYEGAYFDAETLAIAICQARFPHLFEGCSSKTIFWENRK